MATINSRTLKLYIDSTSMSLAHQMADLVRHASDPHCIKLITWLRLPLTEQQLKQHQALYVPQMAAISPDFINLACKIIRDHRITRLNIHSNQTHAWRGVFPLLRALRQLKMDEALDITLDLYDDGTLSLMQREQLKCLPTLEQDVVKAALALKTALKRWRIRPVRPDTKPRLAPCLSHPIPRFPSERVIGHGTRPASARLAGTSRHRNAVLGISG